MSSYTEFFQRSRERLCVKLLKRSVISVTHSPKPALAEPNNKNVCDVYVCVAQGHCAQWDLHTSCFFQLFE